ncbi:MAG: AI-2E family transporter [Myxococcota bacterium]
MTTTILVVAAIYFARSVLAPLAFALLLSVVLAGAVSRVEHLGFRSWRIGRVAAVLLVSLAISGAFMATGWTVVHQGRQLAQELPEYQRNLAERVREPIDAVDGALRKLRNAPPPGARDPSPALELVPADAELVGLVAGWAGSIASLAATAGVVVVLLIFILIEREDLRDRILRVAGRSELRSTGATLRETSERVEGYIKALTLLNLGHGLAVGIGLALLGLPGALLFGMLSALLRFIPYAGPLIAGSAPLAMALAAFDGWPMVLSVGAYLGALELVSNNFVEPWLYGTRVGLSPFAVVLSAIFWGWIWGPVGLVLATPLTVCLVVMGRHVRGLEKLSILLSDSQPLHPHERIFDRLLARDRDGATALFAEQDRDRSPSQTWDETLMPALRLLECDRRQRGLDEEALAFARESYLLWIAEWTTARDEGSPAEAPVFCLPLAAFGDEIASEGLARLLELNGIASRVLPRRFEQAYPEVLARETEAVVVVSALESDPTPIDQLVKRVRRSMPRQQILVGLWAQTSERVEEVRTLTGTESNVTIVTSVAEVVALIGRGRRTRTGPGEPPQRSAATMLAVLAPESS